ncbi:MAG: protein kinase [Acidobacteria bacterium]|nr:protein kinase [Acidobacteriota bacterium]
MTPERYQQIGHLFDAALELPPAERPAFLTAVSGDDTELRTEVEKLLANLVTSEEFLSRPALNVAAEIYAENQPAEASLIGTRISHYEILSLLGVGGMGQVYLAKDTRLGRQVALKLLPTRFMQNAEHLRRFEREALAASALNHPNILTIYEFGVEGETHFLVTEYVQGENLRQRMAQGTLTVAEVLDITTQLASALHAAHQAKIIHRDIKPDNVMIRSDGIVKVLDFGLAKLIEQVQQDDGTAANKQQSSLTQHGAILGTVAYMSPEQARGQSVDERTDLFSLGVVVYELLSGRQPFTGETVSHTIVAILEKEPPPLAASGQEFPAELERILKQLLAKRVEARYPSAADLLTDLKKLAKRLDLEEELQFAAPGQGSLESPTQIIQLNTNDHLANITMQGPPLDSLQSSVDLAHVLFCDIVGYSLLPIDRQTQAMQTLQRIVRQTEDYKRADAKGHLVRLPAGDGMALAFLQDVTAPVRCACDIVRALQSHPDLRLRIGIHSGPVYQSADINANRNVVGNGINLAQRVMDCGDAGHILISRNVAEVLEQVSHWQPMLHDLGEQEVKHGIRLHLFSLYSDEVGNPAIPAKLQDEQKQEKLRALAASPSSLARTEERTKTAVMQAPASKLTHQKKVLLMGALIVAVAIMGVAGFYFWQVQPPSSIQSTVPGALPGRNFSYFLTVQKYRDGKPYQTEFQSSGREIFEADWQFKLNVTSSQDGFLYLLNEQPAANGSDYVLLFPMPSQNAGSARLSANEHFQTSWYAFDQTSGTEQFRLVWAAQPVPELEALRALVNPTDKGRVSEPAQIQAVRAFLQQHSTSPIESARDPQNKQTNVRGTGAVLVVLVELEHH